MLVISPPPPFPPSISLSPIFFLIVHALYLSYFSSIVDWTLKNKPKRTGHQRKMGGATGCGTLTFPPPLRLALAPDSLPFHAFKKNRGRELTNILVISSTRFELPHPPSPPPNPSGRGPCFSKDRRYLQDKSEDSVLCFANTSSVVLSTSFGKTTGARTF